MKKNEVVAMILAGGQGTRLKDLTTELAKPAVHYGGKYRLIDFPLSNCSNSGLDIVGVLTQYEPFVLNTYLGHGSPWDLDRMNGGIYVLPPYTDEEGTNWYKGTANAIYHNIKFIDEFDPEHVVILSGDHIYKMDYSKMLEFHKEKDAEVTISVIEVPWEEASRFGIINTDENYKIKEFSEKPEEPRSNLASMGIYMFKWKPLREYLIKDNQNEDSSNDFGNDILPMMMKDNKRLFAYPFEGYWKDVGTIGSLWEANMDLLDDDSELDLDDPNWHIYSRNPNLPPHYISKDAEVVNSLVNEGCVVDGSLKNSILYFGVTVGKGSKIEDSIILPGVEIKENVTIKKAIIGEDSIIKEGTHIESEVQGKVALVGNKEKVTS
ncbi:MAG: glucose-1-phosphate adenylyltransferase [Bacillota bacterium]